MKLTPEIQKKIALNALVVIALAVVLWVFLVQGQKAYQVKDEKRNKDLGNEIATKEKNIVKETSNRENAKTYQAFTASYEDKMPKGNTETWLLKELSELASHFKLQLANTIQQPITELNEYKFKNLPYQLVGFRFEFKGELNQIGKFIEEIENKMPLMEVDDLSITAGSDIAPHVHTVNMRVSMVTKS